MMTRRQFTAAAAATAASPAFAALPHGYYVPAEEDPHEATFMQWPNSRAVYDDTWWLRDVQATIAQIANTIAAFEPVILLAHKRHHNDILRQVSAAVTLWDIPTEDLWSRDSGALTAVNGAGGRAVSNLNFNGWGNRQVHRHDGKIAARVADALGLPLHDSGVVGEPGGIEQDGHGILIAHESSWVNKNRNRTDRATIENRLLGAYGADRMIWAPGVWNQDITDYHIDALARFTGPGRCLIQLPDQPDPSDPFQMAAVETHDILRGAGLDMTVIPDPEIRRVSSPDFVAAYANHYVCNGAVIASQFGDPDTDAEAIRALKRAYGGREIVTLNADALGELGGGIHCATQQLPAT